MCAVSVYVSVSISQCVCMCAVSVARTAAPTEARLGRCGHRRTVPWRRKWRPSQSRCAQYLLFSIQPPPPPPPRGPPRRSRRQRTEVSVPRQAGVVFILPSHYWWARRVHNGCLQKIMTAVRSAMWNASWGDLRRNVHCGSSQEVEWHGRKWRVIWCVADSGTAAWWDSASRDWALRLSVTRVKLFICSNEMLFTCLTRGRKSHEPIVEGLNIRLSIYLSFYYLSKSYIFTN